MSVQRRTVTPKDGDLETTAELPVLDVAAYETALSDERAGSTDTWHMPALQMPPASVAAAVAAAAAVADDRSQQLETNLVSLSENLRDVEERLTRKGERLLELERELANARADRIAVEERAATLITAEREMAAAGIKAAEDRAAALIASEQERASSSVSAAEQRAAALIAAEQEKATSSVGAAEQRASALTTELGAIRVQLGTEQVRATNLQTAVDERETKVRAFEARNNEFTSLLASREQELARARRDLTDVEGRNSNLLESLQTLEGRRNIFDGQLLGLDDELGSRDVQVTQLETELASQKIRASELAKELADRRHRVEVLEREVATLAASLAQRNVELEQSERAKAKLQESVTSLTETLAARVERIRMLESSATSHNELFTDKLNEIDRLNREAHAFTAKAASVEAALTEKAAAIESSLTAKASSLEATYTAKVGSLETALAGANTALAEKDRAIGVADAISADLEKRYTSTQLRVEEINHELLVARAEISERTSVLLRVEGERDEQIKRFAASEARAVELERNSDDQVESIRQLQDELRTSLTRTTELEGDLTAAEDAINRLETELRNKSAKLEDLSKTQEEWRGTVESARQSLAERESLIHRLETEAANSAALLGNIQQSMRRMDPAAQSGSHEIAPEGAVRLLIRTDGDSEVVHVLGRKTTVGRTPDNDLQIDAKFISRNHAVILAGPNHTIIEDLNSTNGVAINGRRVTRHTLRDGDSVSIGKTIFRFAVRPMVDRNR